MPIKPYLLHEYEYRRMSAEGITSWGRRNGKYAIDPGQKRFWEDALAQSWFPSKGKILEVGCGTGAALEWFTRKGFEGYGLDISPTAIQMAKKQFINSRVQFKKADICSLNPKAWPKFDVCLDGNCLHCLTNPDDRWAMIANCRALLREGGVLVIMSMCAPIDKSEFARLYPGQLYRNGLIYVPMISPEKYDGAKVFNRKEVIPIRCVPHWKRIHQELQQGRFHPQLMRVHHRTAGKAVSSLSLCAIAS
jgi:SAM-dependent methyltransferase